MSFGSSNSNYPNYSAYGGGSGSNAPPGSGGGGNGWGAQVGDRGSGASGAGWGGGFGGAMGFGDPGPSFSGGVEDEPPLLEELGIDPGQIVRRTVAMLNPMKRAPAEAAGDDDVAGPLLFALLMGAAHLMRGAPLAAAEDCCAALRLDSAHTKAQVRLARCLLQLGDFAEARQEATDVAERAGGELQSKSEARGVLEDINAVESAVRDAGDALKMAEIKLQQKENASSEGGAFADDFDVAGAAAEALKSVDAAVALAPAVPDLATLKAEALRFLDRRDEALAMLKSKKATNARRACVEIRLYFDAGNLSACLESAAEIKDVLEKSLKLPCAVEDKSYPRDFWQRGRVRVTLRKEDGTPLAKEFPTKKALMIEIARLVPKHPGRVPGSAEWKKRLVTPKDVLTQFTSQPGQAGAVAAAAGGSGTGGKKKGKKGRK